MNWRRHSDLSGMHAFLSASKYHWINYDEEKLTNTYLKHLATLKGTELHEFASSCIKLKQTLPKRNLTLNLFVNDAIGFKMQSEQVLYYSPNCFGTADAISFRNNMLRIHDLKTGMSPVSMNQLVVYAALFCLEYDKKPEDIKIELRLYHKDEVLIDTPPPEDIRKVMNKIVKFSKTIDEINSNEVI